MIPQKIPDSSFEPYSRFGFLNPPEILKSDRFFQEAVKLTWPAEGKQFPEHYINNIVQQSQPFISEDVDQYATEAGSGET